LGIPTLPHYLTLNKPGFTTLSNVATYTPKKDNRLLKGLLILGGGLLAWNLFSRGQAALSLNFYPGQIKRLSWSGLSPTLTIEMQVQNTSNHSFNILSIAGNVYTTQNGKDFLIGRVADFTPRAVAPVSVSSLDVDLSLQLTGVVQDLINTFQSGLAGQSVKLEAYANVDSLQVPLNYTYKLQ
jgi:hypothetical protein